MEDCHEALQHMTYLHSLRLCDLPNLESLPDCFGKLCLLHHLSIDYSSKLRYLPKSLSLSNLKHLHIASCPLLEKRYWKHKGEDWQKIGHIPKIDVIRRGDVYYDLGAVKPKLEDSEKQFSNRAIKDAAHNLNDIMDECATQELELQYQGVKCGEVPLAAVALGIFHILKERKQE
ncbi:hypothetical protein JHK87_052382 [Glycine soja]|nr:hypothetical protein JHK87_052382 [Glycine soja]